MWGLILGATIELFWQQDAEQACFKVPPGAWQCVVPDSPTKHEFANLSDDTDHEFKYVVGGIDSPVLPYRTEKKTPPILAAPSIIAKP